jgi:hypothetical protein
MFLKGNKPIRPSLAGGAFAFVKGYILLHRKSVDTEIFQSNNGWKIWCWCLMKATHNDFVAILGRQRVILKEGQFVTGRNVAKEELGMGVATIWYWLDYLQRIGNVERKSTNKYSIITILKWGTYQITERKRNANRTTDGTIQEHKEYTDTASPKKARGVMNKEPPMQRLEPDEIDRVEDMDGEAIQPIRPKTGESMKLLLKWAEARRGRKFTRPIVQYTAMKRMRLAKISPQDIRERWQEMENDKFWEEKGFDFSAVAASFDRKP